MHKYSLLRWKGLVFLFIGTIWIMLYPNPTYLLFIPTILMLLGSLWSVASEHEYWEYLIREGKIKATKGNKFLEE